MIICFVFISPPVPLKFGDNVIPGLENEIISLKNTHKCWLITSKSKTSGNFSTHNERHTLRTFTVEFNKHLGKSWMPPKAIFYATSHDNAFGAGDGNFFYGRPHISEVVMNRHNTVELKPTTHNYLKDSNGCATETIYERAENMFVENIKDLCPNPCSPIRMPKEIIPYCDFSSLTQYDVDCAAKVYIDAQGKVENVPLCSTTEYEATQQEDSKMIEGLDYIYHWHNFDLHDEYVRLPDVINDFDHNLVAKLSYRFPLPEVTDIYEEYYISTFEDLVGIVGGTFGLFIGFAFSDATFLLLNYLIIMVEAIKKFFNSKRIEPAFKKTDIKKENPPKPIKKANKVQDAPKSGQESNAQLEKKSVQNQETAIKEENDAPPEPIEKPTVEELEIIEDAPKSGQETILKVEENSIQNQERAIKEENDAPPETIEKPTVKELETIEDAPKSGPDTIVQIEENSAQSESK